MILVFVVFALWLLMLVMVVRVRQLWKRLAALERYVGGLAQHSARIADVVENRYGRDERT